MRYNLWAYMIIVFLLMAAADLVYAGERSGLQNYYISNDSYIIQARKYNVYYEEDDRPEYEQDLGEDKWDFDDDRQ